MSISSTSPKTEAIHTKAPTTAGLSPTPLAYDVATAVRITSLSRGLIYQLMRSKVLASTTIGKRRLIIAQSLHDLIEKGC